MRSATRVQSRTPGPGAAGKHGRTRHQRARYHAPVLAGRLRRRQRRRHVSHSQRRLVIMRYLHICDRCRKHDSRGVHCIEIRGLQWCGRAGRFLRRIISSMAIHCLAQIAWMLPIEGPREGLLQTHAALQITAKHARPGCALNQRPVAACREEQRGRQHKPGKAGHVRKSKSAASINARLAHFLLCPQRAAEIPRRTSHRRRVVCTRPSA